MRFIAALFAIASCKSYYSGDLAMPDTGGAPVHVPLDIAWETTLVVYSGGSPAPMGVPETTGTCVPAAACKTITLPPQVTNDDPRLVVVGLQLGAALVDIAYVHPKHRDRRAAQVHLVFEPAEQLATVGVGSALPAGPFLLAFGASAVRCEPFDGDYACFAAVDHGGVTQYPSCALSTRCSILPAGILVGGHRACLKTKDGRISGATIFDGDEHGAALATVGDRCEL